MASNLNFVEYHLEAGKFDWDIAPGKTIEAWGFNGQVPGPVLRAQKGQTLIVRVTNNLPEPTVVHWHGLRLPAAMDGTQDVQKPIEPGEEFEYRFVVPDAGTFWYHSHANETVQIERGMYGALIVEDPAEPVVVDQERVFVLDDMKLTADHQFTRPGHVFARWYESHMGREGETMLLNGREDTVVEMAAGQIERWRFINSSNARYYRLSLGGRPFQIIGTDGGLLEAPRTVAEVMLAPAERFDLAVGPFDEGVAFAIESLPFEGNHGSKKDYMHFAAVQVGAAQPSVAFVPEALRTIEPLAPQNAESLRTITFSIGYSLENGADFKVNKERHGLDKPVRVGELQIWEIDNQTNMNHPFHLHGFFFQVLEVNGTAPDYRAWKDVHNIPPKSKLKIAWMPDNRPGMWMYHCHVLEHHATGMMASFEVLGEGQTPNEHHVRHHS
jgi:FtsP/CotA-like multicopper oxidase with cupredoxin domain